MSLLGVQSAVYERFLSRDMIVRFCLATKITRVRQDNFLARQNRTTPKVFGFAAIKSLAVFRYFPKFNLWLFTVCVVDQFVNKMETG